MLAQVWPGCFLPAHVLLGGRQLSHADQHIVIVRACACAHVSFPMAMSARVRSFDIGPVCTSLAAPVEKRCFRDDGDEAADLERRASEKRSKAAHSKVLTILKKHPDACEKAPAHLVNLGYNVDTTPNVAPRSRQQQSIVRRTEARKAQDSEFHPSLPEEYKSLDSKDAIPSRIESVEQFTSPMLVAHCLSKIELASMSTFNLRSMVLKKESGIHSAKSEYLRLLEFATGIDKSTRIAGPLRVWRLLEGDMAKQSTWRGRRCKEARLPMNWPEEGVYAAVMTTTGKLAIKIRTTGATKLVPENRIPAGPWSAEGIRIDYNWSETRAALVFESQVVSGAYKVIELFPDVVDHILNVYRDEFSAGQFQVPSQRKALEDSTPNARIPTPRKQSADAIAAACLDCAPEQVQSAGAGSSSASSPMPIAITSSLAQRPALALAGKKGGSQDGDTGNRRREWPTTVARGGRGGARRGGRRYR